MLRLRRYYNDDFEEEEALYNEDAGGVILMGDYYHDKISEKIDGFIEGIEFAKMDFELLEPKHINSKDHTELFEYIGFYSED